MSEFQLETAEALGRIEQKIDGLRTELLGDGGRVQSLEDDFEKYKNKQWLHTAILVPVFTVAHAIANKFGIKI